MALILDFVVGYGSLFHSYKICGEVYMDAVLCYGAIKELLKDRKKKLIGYLEFIKSSGLDF